MSTYHYFEKLMKEQKMNHTSVSNATGVGVSTLSEWKRDIHEPRKETIEKLAAYFNVPLSYFYGNVGASLLESETVKIKVLGTVPAGVPIEAVEDVIGEEEISMKLAETGEFFGLRIKGDSMEPRIFHGDTVIVRQQDDVNNGDVAIVMVNGSDATCKKIEKHDNGIMLVPLNRKYEEKFYTNEDIEKLPVRIIGKVVELRAKF